MIAVCEGQLAWALWHCRPFAVCKGQLACRRCSPSILKKWNLTNPSSSISRPLYGSSPYLSTMCSWGKVELASSSNSPLFSVSLSGFWVACFLGIAVQEVVYMRLCNSKIGVVFLFDHIRCALWIGLLVCTTLTTVLIGAMVMHLNIHSMLFHAQASAYVNLVHVAVMLVGWKLDILMF